jgi:hypothetical protein
MQNSEPSNIIITLIAINPSHETLLLTTLPLPERICATAIGHNNNITVFAKILCGLLEPTSENENIYKHVIF